MNIVSRNAEKISAFADGQLSSVKDGELMEALRGPAGRQLWQNYHCIGDILRSTDMRCSLSENFSERLFHRLSGEAAHAPVGTHHIRDKKTPFIDFSAVGFAAGGDFARRFVLPGIAIVTAAVMMVVGMPKFGGSAVHHNAVASASSKLESALSTMTSNDAPTLSYASSDAYFREHQRYSPSVYSIPQYARFSASTNDLDK